MQELKSEADRKADEVERLRAAEKFMTKGTGEGDCQACGYSYSPKAGDDEYPVPKGTRFEASLIRCLELSLPKLQPGLHLLHGVLFCFQFSLLLRATRPRRATMNAPASRFVLEDS